MVPPTAGAPATNKYFKIFQLPDVQILALQNMKFFHLLKLVQFTKLSCQSPENSNIWKVVHKVFTAQADFIFRYRHTLCLSLSRSSYHTHTHTHPHTNTPTHRRSHTETNTHTYTQTNNGRHSHLLRHSQIHEGIAIACYPMCTGNLSPSMLNTNQHTGNRWNISVWVCVLRYFSVYPCA